MYLSTRSLFAAVPFALALAACQPAITEPQPQQQASQTSSVAAPPAAVTAGTGKALIITLEKSLVESSDATVTTDATLHFTGAFTYDLPLKDVQGELVPVDPKYAAVPTGNKEENVAVFTTWWAGAGKDIRIIRSRAASSLFVQTREGDEGGQCTSWEVLASLPLHNGVEVKVEGLGMIFPASSLAWCDPDNDAAFQ